MKKLILLFVFTFTIQNVFSQNIEKCREVVDLTVEAINIQSNQKLASHLSPNFKMANYEGEIAKKVLNQLISQLNEKILSSNEISNKEINNTLELKYDLEYEKKGHKTATFVFNHNNQLEEVELLEIKVKALSNSQTEVSYPDNEIIEIPFTLIDEFIAVDVLVNNIKRTFILDSGSPLTMLNSRYFKSNDTEEKKRISSVQGVGGTVSDMDIDKIELLDFEGIVIKNQEMVFIDIEHLEESLETNIPIYGLIGYDLIKNYDVLFDYENQKLTLIKPAFFEKYREKLFSNSKSTKVPLKLRNHIPIVNVEIGDNDYAFGIDSGASSNLMKIELLQPMSKYLKNIETETLSGADKNAKKATKGKINKITIGKEKFRKTETIFSDISHLNKEDELNIDGLIGYEILSKQKTLISYKRKTLTFIQ